jgi:hypothetical protein
MSCQAEVGLTPGGGGGQSSVSGELVYDSWGKSDNEASFFFSDCIRFSSAIIIPPLLHLPQPRPSELCDSTDHAAQYYILSLQAGGLHHWPGTWLCMEWGILYALYSVYFFILHLFLIFLLSVTFFNPEYQTETHLKQTSLRCYICHYWIRVPHNDSWDLTPCSPVEGKGVS